MSANVAGRFSIPGVVGSFTVGSVIVADGFGFVCTTTTFPFFGAVQCDPGASAVVSSFAGSSTTGISTKCVAPNATNTAARVWVDETGANRAVLGISGTARDLFVEMVSGTAGSETYNRCFTVERGTGVTITKAAAVGQQSLSGAGAVDIVNGTTLLTTTGANALTLANGRAGQTKRIIHVVDGGDGTLTPTTKTGYSTITFTAVGQWVLLEYASGWWVVGSGAPIGAGPTIA